MSKDKQSSNWVDYEAGTRWQVLGRLWSRNEMTDRLGWPSRVPMQSKLCSTDPRGLNGWRWTDEWCPSATIPVRTDLECGRVIDEKIARHGLWTTRRPNLFKENNTSRSLNHMSTTSMHGNLRVFLLSCRWTQSRRTKNPICICRTRLDVFAKSDDACGRSECITTVSTDWHNPIPILQHRGGCMRLRIVTCSGTWWVSALQQL